MSRQQIIEFFENNNNISLPYGVRVDSGIPGKDVVVFGATHGNESVGVNLGVHLIKQLQEGELKLKKGSITFVLVNPRAFVQNVRYIDKDLNRNFLTNENLDTKNIYEHLRVVEIKKYFLDNNVDMLIDLHSVSIGDFKMFVVNQNDEKSISFLKKNVTFETLLLVRDKDVPNYTLSEASIDGSVKILIECGNHESKTSLGVAKRAVYQCLSGLEMIDEEKKLESSPAQKSIVYKIIGAIKAGNDFRFFEKGVTTGTVVKKGEKIAYTREYGEQVATVDCVIFMPSKKVKPTDYDAGFLCVKVDS